MVRIILFFLIILFFKLNIKMISKMNIVVIVSRRLLLYMIFNIISIIDSKLKGVKIFINFYKFLLGM